MKEIIRTNGFNRDLKRAKKRGLNFSKLGEVVDLLAAEATLPARCRPHKLSGNYSEFWECHIEPDWLLIYEYDDETVTLVRTGTHADLFR